MSGSNGSSASFLSGGGVAGEVARAVDWSKTAIGPVEGWSQALRSTAALVLHNHSGMLLWWGPEFVQIYNDAYISVLGDKHPRAMGQPFRECWSEVFHILGPMAERPFRGGPASTSDDLALAIHRKVPREETHFQIAYSPVPDDTVPGTGIGGVLATVTETTEQAYGARQLRTLRELAAQGAESFTNAREACAAAVKTLAADAWDVPFALVYLVEEGARAARLVASAGLAPDRSREAGPTEVSLEDDGAACVWPLQSVVFDRRTETVDGLSGRFPGVAHSPWGDRAEAAIALPLALRDAGTAGGVLVCGLSPHRVLDDGYRTFFELAAGQLVKAMSAAQAYEAERRRAEQLAELDRAKTSFFSNVSHEFRTPLTLMLGPTEDALSEGRPLSIAELRAVHRNELRMLELVNALLDFSRMEAGRAKAAYRATDLARLTSDVSSAFRSAIERAGLAFHVHCAPLPQPVYVDRGMWERVVLNLLSNALKFTFEGSISVELVPVEAGAELRVKDTGTGIAAHELPHMFERFHRIEGQRGRTYEGSGIGLALVNEIARLHGGTVAVDSALGRGSAFTVRLLYGKGHLPPDALANADVGSAAHGPSSRARALVAEADRWITSPTCPGTSPSRTRPRPRSRKRRGAHESSWPTTTPTCATTSRGCSVAGGTSRRSRTAPTRSRPRDDLPPTSSCPT